MQKIYIRIMLNQFKVLVLFVTFMFGQKAFGQKKGDEFSNKIFNFQFTYNAQFPSGDWAKIYGLSHGLGFGVNYKSITNWHFSLEGNYILSENLKDAVNLINLTNSNGNTINSNNGTPATVSVTMRGWSGFAKVGKIFPVSRLNKNHGFIVQVGAGFLTHYLNYSISQNNVPQLNEDFQRGYDKLHSGYALNQFVGYYFQGENRFTNFFAGFDFTQAFTQNLRGYNYDERRYDNASKNDNMVALRFGWMIPIYLSSKGDEFDFLKR